MVDLGDSGIGRRPADGLVGGIFGADRGGELFALVADVKLYALFVETDGRDGNGGIGDGDIASRTGKSDLGRDRRRSRSDARDVSVFIDRCDLLVGAAPCDGLVGSILRLNGGHLDLFALALDQGEGRLVQGDFVCEDVLFVHGHVVGPSEIEKLALDRSCRLEIGSFDIAEIFDDAEISDSEGELIGKTRHIFRFDRLCDFEEELLKQLNPHYSRVHFVSKRLNCILSVYDQRGCDIVFFDKRHFKKAYFLLHEYLFDYDMKLMESRLKS